MAGRGRLPSGIALTIIVIVAVHFATGLHRLGHTTGDDFALYRQARSIFEATSPRSCQLRFRQPVARW